MCFMFLFWYVNFHFSNQNENHLIKFFLRLGSVLWKSFWLSKKNKGSPKNFKIRLTEPKNQGLKIMKIYALHNLKIESNPKNTLKKFRREFSIELSQWIILKFYFLLLFYHVNFHFFNQNENNLNNFSEFFWG